MFSLFRRSINRVETKLGVNFKHRTILFCLHGYDIDLKKMTSK